MTFKRAANMAWRDIGDETVVLDIRSNRVACLNRAAGRIWQALDREGSTAEIAGRMACDTSAADAAALDGFLHELCALGLAVADGSSLRSDGQAPGSNGSADGESAAILWTETLQKFAGNCGKTHADIGIPDCMASPDLS